MVDNSMFEWFDIYIGIKNLTKDNKYRIFSDFQENLSVGWIEKNIVKKQQKTTSQNNPKHKLYIYINNNK